MNQPISKMHFSKELNFALKHAREIRDAESYVRTSILRTQLSPFDKYRLRLVGDILRRKPRLGRLLDIGSNIGLMNKVYDVRASKVFLCDIDEFAMEAARIFNVHSKNIAFVCGNLNGLPFKDEHFDTVVSLESIEHLYESQRDQAFNEILRVAKTDALICISTPNRFSIAGLEGKIIELSVKGYNWNAWDADHKSIYYSWEFIRFLEKFKGRVQIKNIYGSYFLPGSLLVRIPFWMQNILGLISYIVAKYAGNLFPLNYIGFTTIAVLKKIKHEAG